jgi:hypothetical protein
MTGFTVAVAARRAWAGAIEPPIVGPATTICHHLKRVVEVTCLIEHEDLFNRAQDALQKYKYFGAGTEGRHVKRRGSQPRLGHVIGPGTGQFPRAELTRRGSLWPALAESTRLRYRSR